MIKRFFQRDRNHKKKKEKKNETDPGAKELNKWNGEKCNKEH